MRYPRRIRKNLRDVFSSNHVTALRVIDATKYWQGNVTIPLTIR